MRALLILFACIFFAGCQSTAVEPAAPSQVAAATSLDERLAIGAENAYQASAEMIIAADQAGLLNDETRARLRSADAAAYAKLQLVRRAYTAGNAQSYAAAIAAAWPVIQQLYGLIPTTRSNLEHKP